MKLSEVLQAIRLIKAGNHGVQFHKPTTSPVAFVDMIPGGISHQTPYGHLLLHPQYGHRGAVSGLASVPHGLRLGGTGASASGVYGGHSPPAYHPTGYGGHMGVPSGGHPAPAGYDYHATAPHGPIADTTGPIHTSGKSKTSGSSTITALTLLSFLFFLNILQNCLKEHMDTMNPTVMVMTAGMSRTRVSKLAEMNSREQQHTVSESLPQPMITLNRRDPVAEAASIIEDQVPFNGGNTKIEYSNGQSQNQSQRPDPEPEYYSAYANRTMTLVDNNYQGRHHHPYRQYQRLPGGSFSSPSSSMPSSSSSSSSASNSGGNNYYSDTMDPFYMRIN